MKNLQNYWKNAREKYKAHSNLKDVRTRVVSSLQQVTPDESLRLTGGGIIVAPQLENDRVG